jgi:2-methylcitrate dehydratase PrpD
LALLSKLWLTAEAGHDAVDIGTFDSSAPASIKDVGYKPFPIARQGANAVVAFQNLVAKGLDPQRISTIDVFVPAMNAALLTRPVRDDDRLSRLSNIGFQLACAALAPEVLYDAERAGRPAASILQLAGRVSVSPAGDLDANLPHRWAARVVVNTDSQRLEETVIAAAFDYDAPNLSPLLRDKWRRLLGPQDALNSARTTTPEGRVHLWQRIDACVSMAAQERREP